MPADTIPDERLRDLDTRCRQTFGRGVDPGPMLGVGITATEVFRLVSELLALRAHTGAREKALTEEALVPLVAQLVGDLTGLKPPPANAFPDHLRPAVTRFIRSLLPPAPEEEK
jgi:hypothetical protein